MPYIDANERTAIDEVLNNLPYLESKGQLEYCIFKLMRRYMVGRTVCYKELHDVTYAAHHCADEFRRRFLDKREDIALEVYGDVV